jgi:iron complex transport system permease protein
VTGRLAATALALLALTALSILVATALGGAPIPLGRAAEILFGMEPSDAPEWQRAVLLTVRLPRVLLAAIVGAGLATAGAAMQALFRNPMADPGVLGVSAGASLGAVTALYVGAASLAAFTVPLASFAGAIGAAALVYALSSTRGHAPIATLLLSGIAVSGIASALTSFVLSLSLAEWEVSKQMLAWLMGGLDARTWSHVAMAAPVVLGGALLLLASARDLDAILAGEDHALAVGVDVPRLKRESLAWVSLVTGATVAVAGVVGFVGLMVPHIVRLVVGPSHARLLPTSFFAGAIFLVWADLACRALPLSDLRLGVVTALTGGPFFLYLLVQHRRRREAP